MNLETGQYLIDLEEAFTQIKSSSPYVNKGKVTEVRGPVIKAFVCGCAIGEVVSIELRQRAFGKPAQLLAQVVGFSEQLAILSPYGSTEEILPGATVTATGEPPTIELGAHLLGSVVNGLGSIILPGPPPPGNHRHRDGLYKPPPHPLNRRPIDHVFATGIRAIDAFITLGRGQRMGIFAEPGVGKSSLLAMIAKNSDADINVIGLIGERGREVREFLERTLDPTTRQKTVLVVSTSDESAMHRVSAALTATRIAEHFRDQGYNVMLQIDSLTRLFRAYREVGLAAGEIPVRKGYPPSVFSKLPQLIERTGTNERGSITAFYTILLSSDLEEDPMVEEVKSLTDGHILLKRELAEQNHYPAIDVVRSISRLQRCLLSSDALKATGDLRSKLARLNRDRDLIALGGEPDALLKMALAQEQNILNFLRQDLGHCSSFAQTIERLKEIR